LSAQIDNAGAVRGVLASLVSPQLELLPPIPLFALSSGEATIVSRARHHRADMDVPDCGRKHLTRPAKRRLG
jgi:hypothetical protein